jgi:hypothetical protein
MIADDNADARYRLAQQLASDFVKRFCAPTKAPTTRGARCDFLRLLATARGDLTAAGMLKRQ